MFCRRCGQQLTENMSFCLNCGTPISVQENPAKTDVMNGPGQEEPGAFRHKAQMVPKKKHTLRTVLIIAGCVLAVCGALVPVLINADLNSRYEKASDLLDSGEAEEAKTVFADLGGYKDAKDMIQACDYYNANQLMDSGSYEEAKAAFSALGNYEDADKQAQKCQNKIDYNNAISLKDSGESEQARDIFLSLGSFEDAEALAQECQNQMDYDYATSYMNSADYEEAKVVFESLGSYLDAEQLAAECGNHVDYNTADWWATTGDFYGAYLQFMALGDFSDAAERALACIQPNPENGELYRNPDYAKKSCAINIKNGSTDSSVYLKIYTSDDVLVSTVFIGAGQKAKVKLPSGSYRFKRAVGNNWFGETDMFGNEGYYEVLLFDNGSDVTKLSSSYIYTLSFAVEDGGNISGEQVGAEGF